METEGLLLCSQELATGLYVRPAESSPYPRHISLSYILIFFSHLLLSLPSGLSASVSLP